MQIDHYTLHDELARGGQGVVYRALDTRLKRSVVLKVLHATDPDLQRRMLREAKALAQLQHAHLVPLHGLGEHEGRPYLVLPFVPGESLEERLHTGGPFPVDEALRLTHEVGQALGAAHAAGLVHRDVKPANVLLDEEGRALLTDFGLVKRVGDQESETLSLSVRGNFLGTPGYWPPEQALGDVDAIGPAADVYGLGALLYALLSGRPPRDGATLQAALGAIYRDVEPLSAFRGDVPRWVERLVAGCLQVQAGRRPELKKVLGALEAQAYRRPWTTRGLLAAGLGVGGGVLGAGVLAVWLAGSPGSEPGGDVEHAPSAEDSSAAVVDAALPESDPLPDGLAALRAQLEATCRRYQDWDGVEADAELERLATERWRAERELGAVLVAEVFARASDPGALGDLKNRLDLGGLLPEHAVLLMVGLEILNEVQEASGAERALRVRQVEYCFARSAELGEQEALEALSRVAAFRDDLTRREQRAFLVGALWRGADEGSRVSVAELGWRYLDHARRSAGDVDRGTLAQLSELLRHLRRPYQAHTHRNPQRQLQLACLVAFDAIWSPRESPVEDLKRLGKAREQLRVVSAAQADQPRLEDVFALVEELLPDLDRRIAALAKDSPR